MQACDAHLKNARWHPLHPNRLTGEIYQDAKGRFNDGEVVTTSPAIDMGQGMFRTRSGTIYQVAFAEDVDQLPRRLADYLVGCLHIGWEGDDECPFDINYVNRMSEFPSAANETAGFRVSVEVNGKARWFEFVAREIR